MADELLMLVTCGSAREARKIARSLVNARLAACVNVLRSPVESIYRWKEDVEHAEEFLLLIKTVRARFGKVRDAVREMHTYDVPEIIALPIAAGHTKYLRWIRSSVSPRKRSIASFGGPQGR
jgi:periplasmic divalent cation tolerance protein